MSDDSGSGNGCLFWMLLFLMLVACDLEDKTKRIMRHFDIPQTEEKAR